MSLRILAVRIFRILLLVVAIMVFLPMLAMPARAQGIDIPNTASGALALLIPFFGSSYFSGWLGSVLTEALKSVTKKWAWLGGADTDVIGGLWTKLTVAVLVACSGRVVVALTPLAAYLDNSGLWTALVAFGLFFAHQYFTSDRMAKGGIIELEPAILATGDGDA